jgi:hypothetical protein
MNIEIAAENTKSSILLRHEPSFASGAPEGIENVENSYRTLYNPAGQKWALLGGWWVFIFRNDLARWRFAFGLHFRAHV